MTTETNAPVHPEPSCTDADLLAWVASFYDATFQEQPQARDYLTSRNVSPQEHHPLGYSNRTLGGTLPIKAVKAGKQLRGRLQILGVLRDNGREHLRGCITWTLRDADGEVVDILGFPLGRGRVGDRSRSGWARRPPALGADTAAAHGLRRDSTRWM